MKSEFGKGFIYNLVLFAAHFKRKTAEIYGVRDYSIWFNGASDHLIELKIPKQFQKKKIGKLVKELRDLALDIGHGSRMCDPNCKEDFLRCIELTKEIAFLIDRELGCKPIKANFE